MNLGKDHKFWWDVRWRLRRAKVALFASGDGGDHKFLSGRCMCGHRTTDDPERCELFGGPKPLPIVGIRERRHQAMWDTVTLPPRRRGVARIAQRMWWKIEDYRCSARLWWIDEGGGKLKRETKHRIVAWGRKS